MTEREQDALNDILEAIELIEGWTQAGWEAFQQSEMMQSAVVYRLVVIGEAVGRLSNELTSQQPEIPWRRIRRFRNIATHDYAHVDLNIVWQIVGHDLAPLQQAVRRLIANQG